MPLNGKISPHRLLYPMHSPLLSFNPLPSPAPLIFPLRHAFPFSFRSLLLQSSLSFLILRFSSALHLSEYSLNFYPLSTPFLSLSFFFALSLSCACFEHTRTRTWVSWGAGGFLYNVIKNSHFACSYYGEKKKRGMGARTSN